MKNLKITLTTTLTLAITLTISQNTYCMQNKTESKKTFTPNYIKARKEETKKDIKNIQKKEYIYTVSQMRELKENACRKSRLNITTMALKALKDNSKVNSKKNELSTIDLLEVFLIQKIFIKLQKTSKILSLIEIQYKTVDGRAQQLSFYNPYAKKTIEPAIIENIKLIVSKMLLLKDLQTIDQEKLQSPDLSTDANLKKLDLSKETKSH
jgi:hypothetical protein